MRVSRWNVFNGEFSGGENFQSLNFKPFEVQTVDFLRLDVQMVQMTTVNRFIDNLFSGKTTVWFTLWITVTQGH